MAAVVGQGLTAAGLNDEAIAVAKLFSIASTRAIALAHKVDGLDIAGLQVAGFTDPAPNDAQTFKTGVDQLRTVGMLWVGQAQQVGNFDFSQAVASFIGTNPFGATAL